MMVFFTVILSMHLTAKWYIFWPFGKFSGHFFKKGCPGAGERIWDLLILFIFSIHHFSAEPQHLPISGMSHGYWVYFVVIWYNFSPFWYVVTRKIWQPCSAQIDQPRVKAFTRGKSHENHPALAFFYFNFFKRTKSQKNHENHPDIFFFEFCRIFVFFLVH
jgi:hypothetical protein